MLTGEIEITCVAEVRQDFSFAEYGFNRENLTTMLGQHSLTEDPNSY